MLNFFIYRARPVVNLEAKVTFVSEVGKIDMGNRDCMIGSGERVSCVPIKRQSPLMILRPRAMCSLILVICCRMAVPKIW